MCGFLNCPVSMWMYREGIWQQAVPEYKEGFHEGNQKKWVRGRL